MTTPYEINKKAFKNEKIHPIVKKLKERYYEKFKQTPEPWEVKELNEIVCHYVKLLNKGVSEYQFYLFLYGEIIDLPSHKIKGFKIEREEVERWVRFRKNLSTYRNRQ